MQSSNHNHIETRLRDARDALAKAEAALAAIDAEERDVVASAQAYATWRAKRDELPAEIERLRKLIAILELELEGRSRSETKAAFRRRYTEKVKTNADLAERIPKVVENAKRALLELIREIAISQLEDLEINAALPSDLEPLISADFAARGRPTLPRQELSRERIWLWVRSETNTIIGDQGAVADRGNGRGTYKTVGSVFACEARLFDKVEFNPAEPMERPASLFSVKLVNSDGPGYAYDGDLHGNNPRAVLAALDASVRATQRKRPVEFELIPVAGAVDDAEKTEAGAA